MTTNWHTPFSVSDPLTSTLLNTKLSQLDSGISELNDTAAGAYYYPSLGENVSAGEAGYISIADGNGYKLDTNAAAPGAGIIRGIFKTTGPMGSTGKLQLTGIMDGFTGLTPRQLVYVDTTAGALTQTRPLPTSGGAQIAVMEIGIALSTTEILIRPRPISYEKRDAMALNDTLVVNHHFDNAGHMRKLYCFNTAGGGYRTHQVEVGWWSSTHADMVNQYGGGASLEVSTTFKCLRSAGLSDVTVVVELP